MTNLIKTKFTPWAALGAGFLLPCVSYATQGTFPHGYGVKSEGMGGVVLALPQDSLAGASNPAGMVYVGDRLDLGMAFLKADNGAKFDGQLNSGASRRSLYVIPQFGYNKMLDQQRSIGVSAVGNGVGTGYGKRSNIGGLSGGGSKYQQMVVNLSYAQKWNERHSFGVGLLLLRQALKVEGTSTLNLPEGSDKAYGAGLRLGYQGQFRDRLTLGASLSSKGYMQRMNRFKRLLAERGKLDLPATAGFGLAYQGDGWVAGADVQRIWWNKVRSLGNAGVTRAKGEPGSSSGPGFGWKNQTVYRLGVAMDLSQDWTVRAGYNRGSKILNGKDTFLAVLAPSANREHVTAGLTYKLPGGNQISMAYAYSFKSKQNGRGMGPDGLASPYMGQNWLSIGYGVIW